MALPRLAPNQVHQVGGGEARKQSVIGFFFFLLGPGSGLVYRV